MSDVLERVVDRRRAGSLLLFAVAATAAGITLSAVATQLPGSEPLSAEDAVDALAMMSLGTFGSVLIRRDVAAGLGRALVLTSALVGTVWLCGGLADVLADQQGHPLVAQLLNLASSVLFIPSFVLLAEAPLLLFPTGRLPSPRWRWLVAAAVVGVVASMVSVLLAPGHLDEDVPAWGENPLGVPAMDGVTSALEGIGLALVLASALASAAAVVVRLLRYRGTRRRQMWWFLAGAVPLLVGLVTDSGSGIAGLVSAVVIFAGLLGGMGWALLGGPGRVATDAKTEPRMVA